MQTHNAQTKRDFRFVQKALALQANATITHPIAFDNLKSDMVYPLQHGFLKEMNRRSDEKIPVKEVPMSSAVPYAVWDLLKPAAEGVIAELASEQSPLAKLFTHVADMRCEVEIGGKSMHAIFAESAYAGCVFQKGPGHFVTGSSYKIVLTESQSPFFSAKEQFADFLLIYIAYHSQSDINKKDIPLHLAEPDSKYWSGCICPEDIKQSEARLIERFASIATKYASYKIDLPQAKRELESMLKELPDGANMKAYIGDILKEIGSKDFYERAFREYFDQISLVYSKNKSPPDLFFNPLFIIESRPYEERATLAMRRTELPGLADGICIRMDSIYEKIADKLDAFEKEVNAVVDKIASDLAIKELDRPWSAIDDGYLAKQKADSAEFRSMMEKSRAARHSD